MKREEGEEEAVCASTRREKLERLAEVLGIQGAVRHMPEIVEKSLDLALEMKDPKKKLQRRRKREAARSKTRLDEANSKTRLDVWTRW